MFITYSVYGFVRWIFLILDFEGCLYEKPKQQLQRFKYLEMDSTNIDNINFIILWKALMRRSEGRRSRHEELVYNNINNWWNVMILLKNIWDNSWKVNISQKKIKIVNFSYMGYVGTPSKTYQIWLKS